MSKNRLLTTIFFLTICILSSANSKELFIKKQIEIDKNDEIKTIYLKDFDGDESTDIFIVGKNSWYLFCQKNGNFNKTFDVKLKPLEEVFAYDFGNVDNDRELEIVFFAEGGVYYNDIFSNPNERKQLIKTESAYDLFSECKKNTIEYLAKSNFLYKISDSTKSDVFVPTLQGLKCFSFDNNKYILTNEFLDVGEKNYSANISNNILKGSYNIDIPKYENFNDDDLKDLRFSNNNDLIIFLNNGNNQFDEYIKVGKPIDSIYTENQNIRIKNIKDVNNDGLADIIAGKTISKSFLSYNSQTHIFYCKEKVENNKTIYYYKKSPDYVNSIDGTSVGITFSDMNNNGQNEMIIAKLKINLYKVIKTLLSSAMPLELKIFRLTKQNNYEKTPYKAIELKMYFSFSSSGASSRANSIYEIEKDFTGDGYNDIIIQSGKDKFSIYPNLKNDYSDNEVTEFKSDDIKENYRYVSDYLNNDKKCDILMYFKKKNYLNIYYSNW